MNSFSPSTIKQKVQVWVFYRNPTQGGYSFLLLLTLPVRGSFWQPVTGGVEPGEALDDAAKREATEETGLPFRSIEPLGVSFEYESRGQKIKEYGYSAEVSMTQIGSPLVKCDPHEHSSYVWLSSKEARERLSYASNAQVLDLLLKKLGEPK